MKNHVALLRKTACSLLVCLASAIACAASKNIVTVADSNGMTLYWDALSGSGVLEKNGHHVSFRVGDRMLLLDYSAVRLSDAPVQKDGVVTVTDNFISQAEQFFRTESTSNENLYKIGAILIDPGHGGKDPGASATHTIKGKKVTVVEKDICLDVGLRLYDLLRKKYPNKNIIMTRSTDKYLTLAQRTEIANGVKLKPDEAVLYISVHVNANDDPAASGYEVWYLTPGYRRQVLTSSVTNDKSVDSILNDMLEEEFTTESILISKFVEDGIQAQVGSLSASRGLKAEEWYVVRNAYMPSVLVETGFLTNPKEAALLCDKNYLQKLALGMYNGLVAFVSHFEQTRGFTGK